MPKYFCIGLGRTGTSSLHHAFIALGLRSVHAPGDARTRHQIEQADYHLDVVETTDLYYDQLMPVIFPQMLDAFPDARFIYTIRDEDSWIRSHQNVDFINEPARVGSHRYFVRLAVFGCTVFSEDRYRWVFRDHDRRVRQFFDGALADRLLILDLSKGDGYEKLCPFLGLPVPQSPFPHRNRDGSVEIGKPSLRRRIQRRWHELVG